MSEQEMNEVINQSMGRIKIMLDKIDKLPVTEWGDEIDNIIMEDQVLIPIKIKAPELYLKRKDLQELERLATQKMIFHNDDKGEKISLREREWENKLEKLDKEIEEQRKPKQQSYNTDAPDFEAQIMRDLSRGRGDLHGL